MCDENRPRKNCPSEDGEWWRKANAKYRGSRAGSKDPNYPLLLFITEVEAQSNAGLRRETAPSGTRPTQIGATLGRVA